MKTKSVVASFPALEIIHHSSVQQFENAAETLMSELPVSDKQFKLFASRIFERAALRRDIRFKQEDLQCLSILQKNEGMCQ